MAELLAAISFATGAASLCVKTIDSLKKFSRGIQSAEDDLRQVLTRVQCANNLLDLIRSLLIELKNSNVSELNVVISVDRLKSTLHDIVNLAESVARKETHLKLVRKMSWSSQRSRALELVDRLNQHENELMHILNTISMISHMRSLHFPTGIEEMANEATATVEMTDAFSEDILVNHDTENNPRTWIGHVHPEVGQMGESYCAMRTELSDAAFQGDWNEVFEILQQAKDKFNESWVNATRMKPLGEPMSFWTPMHQTVFMNAPRDVVEKLLQLGGFRTLRTKWTEFHHHNVTPLELAHMLSQAHLYEVLYPVVRSSVPADVLEMIEAQFHALIGEEAGHLVDISKLYLPLIEPLTELDKESVWFPIHCSNSGAGYLYKLDGRGLLVKSVNIVGVGQEWMYRVTEDEILSVGDED